MFDRAIQKNKKVDVLGGHRVKLVSKRIDTKIQNSDQI